MNKQEDKPSSSVVPLTLSREKRLQYEQRQAPPWYSWWKKRTYSSSLHSPYSFSPPPPITARSLGHQFGRRRILQELNLTVTTGTLFGLIGRNGTGKSVLLHLLAGLLQPTAGEILLLGQPFSAWQSPPIGVLYERPIILPELTAMEHLERLSTTNRRPISRSALRQLLEQVAIDPYLPQKAKTFSLGMQKCLNLAQALLKNPPILLLDEPLTALDQKTAKIILRLLREQANQGKAILWTSSTSSLCCTVCDRIGILEGGRLRAEGSPAQIQQHWAATIQQRQISISTLPLPPQKLQFLQNRLPATITQLKEEKGHLTASLQHEQAIPALLSLLQDAAVPIYGLQASDPIESTFLS